MSREVLAMRYAEGVYYANNCQDSLFDDVQTLEEMLANNHDFRMLTTVPTIRAELRLSVFQEMHNRGVLGKAGLNTLRVLTDNGRLPMLPYVLEALHTLRAVSKGEVHLDATFALPPSDEDIANLKAQLASRYGEHLKIRVSIDKTLLAGFVVRVGNEVLDTSLIRSVNNIFEKT